MAVISSVISCAASGVVRRVDALPEACLICMDERQYMPADGVQRWEERPARMEEWDGELAVAGVRASSPGGHWTGRDGCGVVVAGDTVMASRTGSAVGAGGGADRAAHGAL